MPQSKTEGGQLDLKNNNNKAHLQDTHFRGKDNTD